MKVNFKALHAHYGSILDQVTGDLRDAVVDVLAHRVLEEKAEKDMAVEQRLMLPPGVSSKLDAYDDGKILGLQMALEAITDPDWIKGQRGFIEDQFTKEK